MKSNLKVPPAPLAKYQFDVFIIGSGPIVLEFIKESSKFPLKIGISKNLKRWGSDARIVKALHNATLGKKPINFENLQKSVSKLIEFLEQQETEELAKYKVKIYDSNPIFVDSHTIIFQKTKTTVTAKYIIIATGTFQEQIEVSDLSLNVLTTDNFIQIPQKPGSILIIGGLTPLSVEYAGILAKCGYKVTLLSKTMFLRGYDAEIIKKIETSLINLGVRIVKGAILGDAKKAENGRILAKLQPLKGEDTSNFEEFDTILVAGNRTGDTEKLELAKIGINPASNGKIKVNEDDQTTIPSIFALGDCVFNKPEYDNLGEKAANLLAQRLFTKSAKKLDSLHFGYAFLTPTEYGYWGYNEEDAIKFIGKNDIEVFYTNLDIRNEDGEQRYAKIIVTKCENPEIKGFHYFGDNAAIIIKEFEKICEANERNIKKLLEKNLICHDSIIELKNKRDPLSSAKKQLS